MHMESYLASQLVGDPKYGLKKTVLDIGGQALHAGLIDTNIQ